ncbi:MAG: hypothetical protein RSD32_09055, partial [Oscillospiraceae bacterium]
NANVTAEPLNQDILSATCTVDGITYTLADFVNAGNLGVNPQVESDPWRLDKLVSYENWSKN